MILSIMIILTGESEKMQSDRGQFMTNLANGCHKDMLIFCIFKCLSSLFALQYMLSPIVVSEKKNCRYLYLFLHVIS